MSHPDDPLLARYLAALRRWAATPDASRTSSLSGAGAIEAAEHAVASWAGVAHALLLPSGTAALSVAMEALDVNAASSVLLPALDWTASSVVASRLAATVVVVDVDPVTTTISPEAVADAVRPDTAAVVVTHPHGVPADIARIRDAAQGRPVIEDASQAAGGVVGGRMLGAQGDIGVLSLGANKILGTDEGGVALTDDPVLYRRMVSVSQHPLRQRRHLVEDVSSQQLMRRAHPMTALLLLDGLAELDTHAHHAAATRSLTREIAGRQPDDGLRCLGSVAGAAEAVLVATSATASAEGLRLRPSGLQVIGPPGGHGRTVAAQLRRQLFLASPTSEASRC